MNCQEITRILDDVDTGSMPARERAAVEAHLFACADCAADWKVHHRLVTGFAPPLPAGLMDRARAMVVASAAGHARRAPGRAILFGTILVLAAAAAMLGLWLHEPAATTAAVAVTEPAQPAVAPAVEAAPEVQAQAEPAATPEQQPAALPAGSFTVRVLPLKTEGNDATRIALAQRFRDRVMARLGNVHGLILVDPKSSEVAEYEVRIDITGTSSTLYIVDVDATTSAAFAASDAAADAMSKLGPEDQARRRWELERAGTLRSITSGSTSLRTSSPNLALLLGNGFPRPAILLETGVAASRMPDGGDHVENSAGTVVRDLRTKVFPLNAALERELLAILGDSGRKFGERRYAFGGLLSMAERRGGFSTVSAAVIQAGAEFATTAPNTYRELVGLEMESLWDGLAVTKRPELVPYLIAALDVVPTASRLQIIKILAKDFGDDPRTQPALEAVSQRNSEVVVRMAALRESRDESKWREYVVATLNDASLSDTQRLQPIADMVPDRAALTAGNVRSKMQLDDRTIQDLGVLIIRMAKDFRNSDITRNSLQVLSTMESPAARDVLIDVLRAPRNSVFTLKMAALTMAYQQYPNDPKVRAAVEELANDTTPGSEGFMAKPALQIMDQKASMEKLKQQAQPQ